VLCDPCVAVGDPAFPFLQTWLGYALLTMNYHVCHDPGTGQALCHRRSTPWETLALGSQLSIPLAVGQELGDKNSASLEHTKALRCVAQVLSEK
jgi:hypothetical protein